MRNTWPGSAHVFHADLQVETTSEACEQTREAKLSQEPRNIENASGTRKSCRTPGILPPPNAND